MELCDIRASGVRKITAGHFTQPKIYWTCNGCNDAVKEFLRRHVFISNQGKNLTALAFTSDDDNLESLQQRVEQLITRGIF